MTNIFVTSDLHLVHKRILEYCSDSRPYASLELMHDAIIQNWNNCITDSDTTYILGDISFGPLSATVDILKQLNGRKILIKGNHDTHNLSKQHFTDCFDSIHDYYELKYKGELFCLFHYPIEKWNKKHYGSIHLHGHLHSKNPEILSQKRMDVGLDSNNFLVYNIDNIIELMKTVPIGENHHV